MPPNSGEPWKLWSTRRPKPRTHNGGQQIVHLLQCRYHTLPDTTEPDQHAWLAKAAQHAVTARDSSARVPPTAAPNQEESTCSASTPSPGSPSQLSTPDNRCSQLRCVSVSATVVAALLPGVAAPSSASWFNGGGGDACPSMRPTCAAAACRTDQTGSPHSCTAQRATVAAASGPAAPGAATAHTVACSCRARHSRGRQSPQRPLPAAGGSQSAGSTCSRASGQGLLTLWLCQEHR